MADRQRSHPFPTGKTRSFISNGWSNHCCRQNGPAIADSKDK
jgi:hypothetical protein